MSIVLAAVVVNSGVFVIGFWICVTRDRSLRSLLPGALTAAVLWQILQLVGTAYVDHVVKGTDVAYGAFALVLGLMAWIFLAALVLVGSAEIDVVRYRHLYPRALLTPFTDNVELTSADQRTYTDIAAAQQFKGFESVTVSFTPNGSPFDARVAMRAVTDAPSPTDATVEPRPGGRRGRGAGRAPRRGVRGPRLGGPASGTSVASFVGTVAERTNAPALKAGGSQGPGVRIPPVPPGQRHNPCSGEVVRSGGPLPRRGGDPGGDRANGGTETADVPHLASVLRPPGHGLAHGHFCP